jgi:hypothetical protein
VAAACRASSSDAARSCVIWSRCDWIDLLGLQGQQLIHGLHRLQRTFGRLALANEIGQHAFVFAQVLRHLACICIVVCKPLSVFRQRSCASRYIWSPLTVAAYCSG